MRLLEVETSTPSPFAASLLFGYVGAFMYEGDSPLAERRAAALALDPTLLAELLGRVELRELLDAEVVATTTRQLQHLTAERSARDAEGVADLLRLLGPLTTDEVAERCAYPDIGGWLEGLLTAKRVVTVSFAGQTWWVAVEDIGRLRDGVGVAVPVGVPMAFLEPIVDPLGELLSRYARTRGPFTTADAAARFGLGLRVAADVLGRLAVDGKLMRGEFIDVPTDSAGVDQWCDAEVLRILRRRSLAALRAQIEPVSTAALGRFLPAWQLLGSETVSGRRRAGRGDRSTRRCAAARLGGRAADLRPTGARLSARGCSTNCWPPARCCGRVPGRCRRPTAGWRSIPPTPQPLSLTPPARTRTRPRSTTRSWPRSAVAVPTSSARSRSTESSTESLKEALWQLIWSGHVGGDTFAPVRALLAGTRARGRSGGRPHRHTGIVGHHG